MCAHRLFCAKFISEKLLYEQYFEIFGNFGSLQPESESTFLQRVPKMTSHILFTSQWWEVVIRGILQYKLVVILI